MTILKGACFLDDNDYYSPICNYIKLPWYGERHTNFISFRLIKYS